MTDAGRPSARRTTRTPSRTAGCRCGTASTSTGPGRREGAPKKYVARHVPVPERRPAHGPRRGVRHRRRRRALLDAARLRRAAPDRLGLLRAARRERRDQARRAPGDVDLRQHRDAGRVVPPLRDQLRLVAPAAHVRPGVLPLDAVAVPALPRARPGLPQGLARSTGARTTRPCWPTSRSSQGACERCGARGHQARADPVVLQDHRLRRPAAGRHGAAGGHLARAACCRCSGTGSAARTGAHVDFVVGGPRRSRSSRPGRTRCTARRSSSSPPTRRWPTSCARPTQREALEAYRDEVRKLSDIDRQSTDRPKTGVDLGVTAINPVNGEQIPVYAADYVLADYGTGAIMAVPAHDQRDLDFARAFGLPVRVVVDTGEPDPAETGVATAGDGVLVNSGPLRRAAQGRGDRARSSPTWRRAAAARARSTTGCATGCCRGSASGARRSRSCTAPVAAARCRARRPAAGAAARPARRGAEPEGHLAAGRGDRLGRRRPARRCGGPATRDTDTMDTFVDSSWYFLRYCSPDYEDGPFDPDGGARVDAGRAVRRRRRARDPAPAVQPVLHQGAARHGHGRLRSSRSPRCMNQGQVINQGKAMSKSLGNGVDLGEELAAYGVDAVRLTMVFAGPPEDDVDWADVSPAGSVKYLARVAAAGRRTSAALSRRRPRRRPSTGPSRRPSTRSPGWSRRTGSTSRSRGFMELTNGAAQGGRRAAPPAGVAARRRRGAGGRCWLLRAVHRRGGLVAAGPRRRGRRLGARIDLADRRPGAAGRGDRHLRRAGRRQGPRPARGAARHRRGRAARAGAGLRRRRTSPGRRRRPHGRRARAEAGQRRARLTVR